MFSNQPLAERMRPRNLDEFIGQKHLVGEGAVIRKAIAGGRVPSFILWGTPGIGKTTLANLIAQMLQLPFFSLSAVHAGVKDVREAIDQAKRQQFFQRAAPILFIDEIHRFSKSQQDALLGAVEQGTVTLIGATTENPSFEVIPALLSRCQVYVLQPLTVEDLTDLLHRALQKDEYLKDLNIELKEVNALLRYSGGDARRLLNALEIVVYAEGKKEVVITDYIVTQQLQQHIARYDKSGEQHYDIISAFIKSMRGSDPDAAVYWLARMLAGGEDIVFIARRMLILAAEDIGLANPNALLLANTCLQAVQAIGMPEARIILSQTALYLANSPKSNSAYLAIGAALDEVKKSGDLPVPLHLRNAPTALMKQLGYSEGYRYAHDFEGNVVEQLHLPEALRHVQLYIPQANTAEQTAAQRLAGLKKGKEN